MQTIRNDIERLSDTLIKLIEVAHKEIPRKNTHASVEVDMGLLRLKQGTQRVLRGLSE